MTNKLFKKINKYTIYCTLLCDINTINEHFRIVDIVNILLFNFASKSLSNSPYRGIIL